MGKNRTKARTLKVAASAPMFYERSQEQKQPEFQEKYKKRSAQEWKNGEMKRFHGMARARGWGLRSIRIQVKLTAIAVNLKRIAALISGKPPKREKNRATAVKNKGANFIRTIISLCTGIQHHCSKMRFPCTAPCP